MKIENHQEKNYCFPIPKKRKKTDEKVVRIANPAIPRSPGSRNIDMLIKI